MKFFSTFLLAIVITPLFAQALENNPNPYGVCTFECASVYWVTPQTGKCSIKYKETNVSSWKQGLDLVYDSRQGEYRGSIIGLKPDTEYQVELTNTTAKTQLKVKTRSDKFPVGKKTFLPSGETDKPVVITESGTPTAYHLVTVPDGSKSTLNLKNVYDNGIEINADYVIVRGIEIRNPSLDGIRIKKDRHNIVVEQCYITFWGGIGGSRTFGNTAGGSAIYVEDGTQNLTFQRNFIEEPRGATNDWVTGHPAGPQGITVVQSKGGNVIRYNDIISTEDHGFNDGIGGSDNFSKVGNMNRDSDIYGNIVQSCWDDAIESEGANMNVRIWGNYLNKYFRGIATASTTYGPCYMFRNIFAQSRLGHENPAGGGMFKLGGRDEFQGGWRYFLHNTAVQPGGPASAVSRCENCFSRNNLFDLSNRVSSREPEPNSDFDYDYGYPGEEHGISLNSTPAGTKLLVESYNMEFYPRSTVNSIEWGGQPIQFGERERSVMDPVRWVKNPIIDGGTILPGFNDDFKGKAPDAGAFEVGNPPLQFGRRAYLKYDEAIPAWEK